MFIFDIENPTVNLELKEVEKGGSYIFPEIIRRERFGQVDYNYFYEMRTSEYIQIMTNKDGKKVFAVATNDSPSDGFAENELAKIIIEPGGYIVIYNNMKDGYPIVTVFEVDSIEIVDESPVLIARCVELLKSFKEFVEYRGVFTESVDHITMKHVFTMSEYLTPKYCYNAKRVVTTRLFRRSTENEFYSFLPDGTRLILNNKSEIYNNPDIKDRDYIAARCFYSKRFGEKNVKFVDGDLLETLDSNDVEKYIEMSSLDRYMAESCMKIIKTSTGNPFLSIVNLRGEIRIIYKSFKGFVSFPLNEYELRFVKETYDAL